MKYIEISLFLKHSARALAVMVDRDVHLVLPGHRIAYVAKSQLDAPIPDSHKCIHYKKSNFLSGARRVCSDLALADVIKVYRHSQIEMYLEKIQYTPNNYVTAEKITDLPTTVRRLQKPALTPLQLEVLLEAYYKPVSASSRLGLYLKTYSQYAAQPAVIQVVDQFVKMGFLKMGGPANTNWEVTADGRRLVDKILQTSAAAVACQKTK